MSLIQRVLEALYPRRCVLCDQLTDADIDLCYHCSGILPVNNKACPRCALPLHGTASHCGECLRRERPWQRAEALWRYEGAAQWLIRRYKFQGRLYLGHSLSCCLARHGRQFAGQVDAVVPVPLHWRRLWQRGHNQAERLARPLAQELGLPLWCGVVERVRYSQPLSRQRRKAERQRLRRDSFRVARNVRGQRILLVDDVMTTGATLEAVTHCLLDAGAAEVSVLVLARTP